MSLSKAELIELAPRLLQRPIVVYEAGKKVVGYVTGLTVEGDYVTIDYKVNRTGQETGIGFALDYGHACIEGRCGVNYLLISVPMIGTGEVRMNN